MNVLHYAARRELQYSIDYYEHYHRGEAYGGQRARRPIYRDFPLPYWDPPRPDPAFTPPARLRTDEDRVPFRKYLRTDTDTKEDINEQILQTLREHGLDLIRVVGAGSQGLAALFQHGDEKVVLKWGKDIECMVLEMWAMRQLVGARHIVQRRYIPGLWDHGVASEVTERMINHVLSARDSYAEELAGVLHLQKGDRLIYAMEWARHGNFNGLLRKMSMTEAVLRNEQLWRVFHCLFRAVVALAYPGRWDRGLDPEKEQVDTREEFIPLDELGIKPLPTDQGILDMDLNDRNVLIGDYICDFPDEEGLEGARGAQGHPHDRVPVFKVADLGNLRGFRTERFRRSFMARVRARVCGNPHCNSPEQFTQAWNNHVCIESLELDETAGQFDWWTNLWEIAQLMAMMITRFLPDIPPTCVEAEISKPTGEVEQVFTYGSHLLADQYDHYDRSLRNTVAWCLAHRPRDRPTMRELDRVLRAAMRMEYALDADETARRTVGDLLCSPPPPRPHVAEAGSSTEEQAGLPPSRFAGLSLFETRGEGAGGAGG